MSKVTVPLEISKRLRSAGFIRKIIGGAGSRIWFSTTNNFGAWGYTTAEALSILARRERRVLENAYNWYCVGPNQWVRVHEHPCKYYTRTEAYDIVKKAGG